MHHLVRVGSMGHVGRFASADSTLFPRHSQVIVRTSRGLEIGEVLGTTETDSSGRGSDGPILRGMTDQDHLLQARLDQNRQDAFESCVALLQQHDLAATLLDVEPLFDGRTLFFYFLGDITPEIESLTAGLAEAYESKMELSKFAEMLTEGCGPGCGTDEASGGGCGVHCVSCSVASACGTKKV